ncbi:VanW family protein [Candidatus Daviesbacteria bacterium]|nr:VanW family protein [Candidatus Daviesbacteria bacterium]
MLDTALVALTTTAALIFNLPHEKPKEVLASHEISLKERTPGGGSMSDVMADNILLTLAYLNNDELDPKNVNWSKVRENRTVEFSLMPNQAFAYHEGYLEEYKDKIVKTTNARFSGDQGFKHDGYLMGDGVCHLASLIYWVALDAKLDTKAPVNHDFMLIPGIDKKYGVSIYHMPGSDAVNAMQNLYIKNNLDSEVTFEFKKERDILRVNVIK